MVEEFVFRGCVVPLLLVGGWKEGRVVLLSPLFFGLGEEELGVGVCISGKACFCGEGGGG